MTQPDVTIIIPVYNEARYLERLWTSIKQQTYKNYTVFFIDDGSTDGSRAWIQELARNNKNVRELCLPHTGSPGFIRNIGADLATTNIICFIDADMMLTPTTLNALITPLKNGEAIATCHNKEYRGNIGIIPRLYKSTRVEVPAGSMHSVPRAILRENFLTMKFDTTRGYFDDKLPTPCVLAVETIIHHNNPETLGEVLRHITWVAKSIIKNKHVRDEVL